MSLFRRLLVVLSVCQWAEATAEKSVEVSQAPVLFAYEPREAQTSSALEDEAFDVSATAKRMRKREGKRYVKGGLESAELYVSAIPSDTDPRQGVKEAKGGNEETIKVNLSKVPSSRNTRKWLERFGVPKRLAPAAWCSRSQMEVAVPTNARTNRLVHFEGSGWSTWYSRRFGARSSDDVEQNKTSCQGQLELDFFETEHGPVDAWTGSAAFAGCGGYTVRTERYVYHTNIFRAPGPMNNVVVTCACPIPQVDYKYCAASARWETMTNAKLIWEEGESTDPTLTGQGNKESEQGDQQSSAKVGADDTGEATQGSDNARGRRRAAPELARAVAGGYPLSAAATAGTENDHVITLSDESRIVFESHAYGVKLKPWPWQCTATCADHLSEGVSCQQDLLVGGCPVSPLLDFKVHAPESAEENESRHEGEETSRSGEAIIFSMKPFVFERDVEEFGEPQPMKFQCEMKLYEEQPQLSDFCNVKLISFGGSVEAKGRKGGGIRDSQVDGQPPPKPVDKLWQRRHTAEHKEDEAAVNKPPRGPVARRMSSPFTPALRSTLMASEDTEGGAPADAVVVVAPLKSAGARYGIAGNKAAGVKHSQPPPGVGAHSNHTAYAMSQLRGLAFGTGGKPPEVLRYGVGEAQQGKEVYGEGAALRWLLSESSPFDNDPFMEHMQRGVTDIDHSSQQQRTEHQRYKPSATMPSLQGLASDAGDRHANSPIFEEVRSDVVYDDWHVVWRRDRYDDITQVGVGNWFGFADITKLSGDGGAEVSTGWRDVLVDAFVDDHGHAYGVGVIKGDYGVQVNRDNEDFATGVNIIARGVEVGTLADILDRDYGQRIKVRGFDLSVRHDFDEFIYQDPKEFATDVRMIWKDVAVVVGSDVVDTEYAVSVGVHGNRMSVLRDFDERVTDFQGNWGNGWKLLLQGDFQDEWSDAVYGRMGFGQLGRVYVSAGAGIGDDGVPQGSAEVLLTDVGLNVAFFEGQEGERFFNYAFTAGKFTYVWDSIVLPENIRVPTLFLRP